MSDSTDDDDTQPTTIRFPHDVHEALRRKAFDERTAMNTLVVRAVRKGLGMTGGSREGPRT